MPHQSDQHAGPGLLVDRALGAFRTGVARLQRFVRDLDLFAALIGVGPVAAMAFRRRPGVLWQIAHIRRLGLILIGRRRRRLGLAAQHSIGLLGTGAEEQLS